MENLTNGQEVVNEEVVSEKVVLDLLPEGTEYRVMAAKAKELGLNYIGVKKEVLFASVNEQIAKINAGEAEMPVIETPTDEDENPSGESESTEEGTQTAPKAKQPKAPAAPRVKAPKWFEEANAFPYDKGDVVKIVTGKDLIGRLVQVEQPSAKKNAFKGYLIHPVTGQLQRTFLSVDFDRVELVSKAGQPQEVTETPEIPEVPTAEVETTEVTNQEAI